MSDRAVREAVESGARTVEAVAKRCTAATRCGGCLPELERLLAELAPAS